MIASEVQNSQAGKAAQLRGNLPGQVAEVAVGQVQGYDAASGVHGNACPRAEGLPVQPVFEVVRLPPGVVLSDQGFGVAGVVFGNAYRNLVGIE